MCRVVVDFRWLPVTSHLRSAIRPFENGCRGKLGSVLIDRAIVGYVTKLQILENCFLIDVASEPGSLERSNGGSKCEDTIVHSIDERFHTESITYQKKFSRVVIPKRKSKHPSELLNELIYSPCSVAID